MHPEFWHERWQTNRIGFHQDRPTPLLLEHWPALSLPTDARVFVPLAGKSLDMAWLAARGHHVLGVELSEIAVRDFFAEHDLTPQTRQTRHGTHYLAERIELICGDVFNVDANLLAHCNAVYDRAALIALPADLREPYVRGPYAQLPRACRGLVITLEYPAHEKAGPPFPVADNEVHALFSPNWTVIPRTRRDILAEQPGFIAEGVTSLTTSVFEIERR